MPRNDEGEFELVLGNRQLLSVFFILVVLLGVFFTMGYIVGRSNPAEPVRTAAIPRRPPIDAGVPNSGAFVVDPAQKESVVEPGKASPAAVGGEPAKPIAHPPPAETKPSAAAPPKAEPPKPKPEPVKQPPPVAPAPTGGLPQAGATYLQVAAVDRAGADILAETLRKKSLPAMVAPGPSPTLFRVLVGPFKDKEERARLTGELEAIGLKGPIMRQY